jgi:hypothetical protein
MAPAQVRPTALVQGRHLVRAARRRVILRQVIPHRAQVQVLARIHLVQAAAPVRKVTAFHAKKVMVDKRIPIAATQIASL